MKVQVPVRVILAEGLRSVKELLELEPNDVVPFMQEAGKHSTVLVGRTPRFIGRPGIGSGRRYAIKLVSEIKDADEVKQQTTVEGTVSTEDDIATNSDERADGQQP